MRWGIFIVMVLIGLVLDTSLAGALRLQILGEAIKPSMLALLALFVALWAPRLTALWGCLLIGLIIDAASPLGSRPLVVVVVFGPHALGYVFACFMILQLRGMVLRKQLLAFGFLAVAFVIASAVLVTAILTVRSWYAPELAQWSAGAELVRRFLQALYTGLVAVPLGWVLLQTTPFWGFATLTMPRSVRG